MTKKDDDFQLDIVQRLTRLETKIDMINNSVKVNTERIMKLENRADKSDTQLDMIKKGLIVTGAIVGVVGTCVGIIVTVIGMI